MARASPKIARHGLLKLFNGDGGAPEAEARAGADGQFAGHKACGLDAFDGGGQAAQGKADIGADVCGKAPQHAVAQGIHFHVEQHPGPEKTKAERPLLDQALADPAGIGKGGKQQRVDPDESSGREARHGAARRGAFPHQGAKEGRGELGHGGKGDQADLGKRRRRADHPVVAIGQHQHEGDGQPPDGDQGFSHVMDDFRPFRAAGGAAGARRGCCRS